LVVVAFAAALLAAVVLPDLVTFAAFAGLAAVSAVGALRAFGLGLGAGNTSPSAVTVIRISGTTALTAGGVLAACPPLLAALAESEAVAVLTLAATELIADTRQKQGS
jgi:hypothetical protein